ncbi:MAG TPA: DUF4221 family protein, partial [Saprospiraceae bacterium]|nr:DUF4221 family protein [Saprospiraceae bacterium]
MHPIVFHLLLIFFTLSACTPQVNETRSFNISFSDEIKKIPLIRGGTIMVSYARIAPFKSYLTYSYNNYTFNRIEVYDFQADTLLFVAPYEQEGPNGVPKGNYHLTDNYITFTGSNEQVLLDFDSKIIKKYPLMNTGNRKYSQADTPYDEYWLRLASNFRGISKNFDHQHERIHLGIIRQDISSMDKQFFNSPSIIAVIDFQTDTIQALPIHFPEGFERYQQFGSRFVPWELVIPFILAKGDSVIYNFMNSDDIYVYDMIKKKITGAVKASSKYTASEVGDLPAGVKNKFTHLYQKNPNFGHITYDPWRNYYYRIHYAPARSEEEELKDQLRYFMIMDQHFKVLAEIQLEQDCSSTIYGPAPEGVYFKQRNPPSEDT